MLSLSNVSPAQGERYYSKENYYSADATQANSQWFGRGAAQLGLSGEIQREQFSHLLHGRTPTGEVLPGRTVRLTSHRAGLDLTFSAPKSISIAALVGGDRRLEEAHRTAVNRTLAHIEQHHAQVRLKHSGQRQRITTSNLIVAQFHHDTSRELDPQMHTHCVAINATQLSDGSWKALSNESIYQNAKLLGSIYKNELAYEVRKLGYAIEGDRDCLFELKGYSPDVLQQFSKRRQQILEAVGVGANAREREWATICTRAAKGEPVPREILHERWQEEAQAMGLTAHPPATYTGQLPDTSEELARELVDRGVEHCAERSAVFRRTSIQTYVLEQVQPFNLEAMETAIANHPELIPTLDNRLTTAAAREREEVTIRLMQANRDAVAPVLPSTFDMDTYLEKQTHLNEGQQEGIRLAIGSRDRFIAWQGVAGAGKTRAISQVQRLSCIRGYKVRAFAPSAEAAKVLGDELSVGANTVASLLHSPNEKPNAKQIWVVDEASLLSAKDAKALMERAVRSQARVIFIGDVRQLSAVEAGNPFRSLQQAGMATAHLVESWRQKTPDLKSAVDAVARGEIDKGLEQLARFDRVREIVDDGDRRSQLVADYMALSPSERSQTLVLAGTHAERSALTDRLRRSLTEEGALGAEVTVNRLRSKDLTDVQSRFAHHYELGDVVVPVRHYRKRGLLRTEQYQVMAIAGDRLLLECSDGSRLTVDPMQFRKQVYVSEAIAVAVGDRLRWTQNDKENGRRNGQELTVTGVDRDARSLTVVYRDGRQEAIAFDGGHHLDYDWVKTVHASQGKTAQRALVMADGAMGRESFYVAVSRVRQDLRVYTKSQRQLLDWAKRSRAQENPSDVVEAPRVKGRTVGTAIAEEVGDREQLEPSKDGDRTEASAEVSRSQQVVDTPDRDRRGAEREARHRQLRQKRQERNERQTVARQARRHRFWEKADAQSQERDRRAPEIEPVQQAPEKTEAEMSPAAVAQQPTATDWGWLQSLPLIDGRQDAQLTTAERQGLARMEALSDEDFLTLVREVDRHRYQLEIIASHRPPPEEIEQLTARQQSLHDEFDRFNQQYQSAEAELERLGPRRSLLNLFFGSPARLVDAAEARLSQADRARRTVAGRWKEISKQLKELQSQEDRYQNLVRSNSRGKLLQPLQDLKLESVRSRLAKIREVNRVERWREAAAAIGQSDVYLACIDDVTRELQQGQTLSELGQTARDKDLERYQYEQTQRPNALSEARNFTMGVRYFLNTYGERQNGVRVFHTKSWQMERTQDCLEVRSQEDGMPVLRVEGGKLTVYRPTEVEKEKFERLLDAAESDLQKKQQAQQERSQDRGFSLGR